MIAVGIIGMFIIASMIMGVRPMLDLIFLAPFQVIFGVSSMFAFWFFLPAWYTGKLKSNWIMCGVHGLLTFSIGVFAACTVNVAAFSYGEWDFRSYGYKPAYWLFVFGVLPSIFIGILYRVIDGVFNKILVATKEK